MNIVASDWLPYVLPFRQPWQTAQGSLNERRGKLIRLRDEGGLIGWGDCAPLPEFGIDEAAATAFAEECAQLDLRSQIAGRALNAWLSDAPPVANLAVNCNLGALFNVAPGAVQTAVSAGYSILKLKIGIASPDAEIAALQRLVNQLPGNIELRLDANRAWSTAEARRFIEGCRQLPVESLEEPLSEPDLPELAWLQARAAFPLAIDESSQLLNQDFFAQRPVRRLVLKPARHGGLLATRGIARQAQAAGIECIVTSSLESTCGLLACMHLAAAIAPAATHGLATAECFLADTGHKPQIDRGRITVPQMAGLGFQPES